LSLSDELNKNGYVQFCSADNLASIDVARHMGRVFRVESMPLLGRRSRTITGQVMDTVYVGLFYQLPGYMEPMRLRIAFKPERMQIVGKLMLNGSIGEFLLQHMRYCRDIAIHSVVSVYRNGDCSRKTKW
jgi:hypothetical protein